LVLKNAKGAKWLFKKHKDVIILGVDVNMNSVIIAVNHGNKIIDVDNRMPLFHKYNKIIHQEDN
jgi:hypothetical protein